MTHYKVLVIGEASNPIQAFGVLEEMLAPYDENLVCEETWQEIYEDSLEYYIKKAAETDTTLIDLLNERFGEVKFEGEKYYYKTTSNPNSEWDWYVLGGRWSGALGGYLKPNHNTTRVAGGRSGVFDNDTGIDLAFATELDIEKMKSEDFSVYAILDESGWVSKGDIGWWGISANDKATWDDEVKEYLTKLVPTPNTFFAVVDCHI